MQKEQIEIRTIVGLENRGRERIISGLSHSKLLDREINKYMLASAQMVRS